MAIVANQPSVKGGAIDSEGADKGARFLQIADSFHLPVINLCDNPGVLAGSDAERAGILRHGGRMFAAQVGLQTIKFHVTLRKAYGFGGCIMGMLDEEIARAHRNQAPCSVALIDLDWFKRINDTYGHPTGDEVLRTFAITVFANVRPIDKFGRYGGEEFLLLLPDTSDEGAARILDRLRAIIADLDWSAFSPGMQVTISAGVATLKPNETPDIILARADSALYAAKARGRNRIASA